MRVTVESLTRECQYVDEKSHVCGRLAYYAAYHRVGSNYDQLTFRCREHRFTVKNLTSFVFTHIDSDATFGLGYDR